MKKATAIFLLFLFIYIPTKAQSVENNTKTALLIVDIQDFYFPGDGPGLLNAEEVSLKAKEVLELFRKHEQLVIHVRHQSNKGFSIHKNVLPLESEKLITKKEVNSFFGTDLHEYLQANNITRLVIIGMQTQMCVEAAVRAAHDLNYECIVIPEACTTKDLKFNETIIKASDVHASTLATLKDGGYAKIVDLASLMLNVDKIISQPLE